MSKKSNDIFFAELAVFRLLYYVLYHLKKNALLQNLRIGCSSLFLEVVPMFNCIT